MQIEPNRVVYIRYVMKNQAGEVLEDTMEKEPIGFLFGANTIHQALQQQLLGLKAGDKSTVSLHLSHFEDFVFETVVDAVRMATDTEIMLGYPLQSAQKCDDNCDCYES